MITKEQALKLEYGEIIYEITSFNFDHTPKRWIVKGKCKTWKNDPNAFKIPIKSGLNQFGYLSKATSKFLCLGVIKRVCIRCNVTIGWKDAERKVNRIKSYEISHSVCKECQPEYEKELGL